MCVATHISRASNQKMQKLDDDWSKSLEIGGRSLYSVAKHVEMRKDSTTYHNTENDKYNMCGSQCNAVFLVRGPELAENEQGETMKMSFSYENFQGDIEKLKFSSEFLKFEKAFLKSKDVGHKIENSDLPSIREQARKCGFKSIADSKNDTEVKLWAADITAVMISMIETVFFDHTGQDDFGLDIPIENIGIIYDVLGVDKSGKKNNR